jgi:hypothetical protein
VILAAAYTQKRPQTVTRCSGTARSCGSSTCSRSSPTIRYVTSRELWSPSGRRMSLSWLWESPQPRWNELIALFRANPDNSTTPPGASAVSLTSRGALPPHNGHQVRKRQLHGYQSGDQRAPWQARTANC